MHIAFECWPALVVGWLSVGSAWALTLAKDRRAQTERRRQVHGLLAQIRNEERP